MTVIARVLIKETLGCIVCVRMVRMIPSVMLQPTSSGKIISLKNMFYVSKDGKNGKNGPLCNAAAHKQWPYLRYCTQIVKANPLIVVKDC